MQIRNHLAGDGQRIPAAVAVALANPMEDFSEHMGQQGQCGFLTFLIKEDVRILYRGLQFGEPSLGLRQANKIRFLQKNRVLHSLDLKLILH